MADNVVNFGVFVARIKRGLRREAASCPHVHITIDADGGTLECDDCGKSLSAFHQLVVLAERRHEVSAHLETEKHRAVAMRKMLSGYKVRLRALKVFEASWWRGDMAPCCPHCRRGLFAEDFAGGASAMISRDYEMALRKRPPHPAPERETEERT